MSYFLAPNPAFKTPNHALQTQQEGPFPSGEHQPSVASEYMRVLLRNRWLIAIFGLTGLMAALLISLSMRAEYEATARIGVELDSANPLERRTAADGTQIST